jgi:hypothetical protein
MSPSNAGLELLPPEIADEVVDLTRFGVNEWAIPERRAVAVCRRSGRRPDDGSSSPNVLKAEADEPRGY